MASILIIPHQLSSLGGQGLNVGFEEDGLEISGAIESKDGVGGVTSFHQSGHSLAKVQVVEKAGGHALWGGNTRVDCHLV